MPDLKLDLKNPATTRLMELDTSTLFLPFGRPIADYLGGQAGSQNGTRAELKQGAIDFSPLVRWTGFGELEQEGLTPAAATAEPADPGVADFLALEPPGRAAGAAGQGKTWPPIASEPNPVFVPRLSALP